MTVALGVDIGTTTITCLALDTSSGEVAARSTAANDARIVRAGQVAGASEWDAERILDRTVGCLKSVVQQIPSSREIVGVGITGQQHGVVLVDASCRAVSPFINWQDRRAEAVIPGSAVNYVERARELVGSDAAQRAGCRLAAGYMGATLFWLMKHELLMPDATACFIMDLFAARLTRQAPVSDPSSAASSGLFDVASLQWDTESISRLGLPDSVFPKIGDAGEQLGVVAAVAAEATGLPAGLPVFVAIGDNQASFIGSVADRSSSVLINVGTGGQVAAFSEEFHNEDGLEIRPVPLGGFLMVNAGLCGGRTYAVLERFFREVGRDLFGIDTEKPLFDPMNRLAAAVAAGADGLRFSPLFSGTRDNPELRASLTGVSSEDFTPAHLVRALLEGMATVFQEGRDLIQRAAGKSFERLVGAGNGLRDNAVLVQCIEDRLDNKMEFSRHREEAAIGAALVASVGAGAFPDLPAAGCLIHPQSLHEE